MAIGFVVRSLRLSPHGRVLEFGPGYGKLTLELARSDFRVTAVDINPRLLALVGEECRRFGVEALLVCSGMLDYHPAQRFDRVVFYESFHHCDDPDAMIRRLDDLVVPGGAVVFGGEPVHDDFPVPWGVRTDGRSLWAIRHHGWLELGFRTDFFVGLLARHGWSAQVFASDDVPWQRVFVARRASETR
jgi:SAM-dependent methyltransferase